VVGAVLQRPVEVGVEAMVKHDPSLDSIDSVCRKDFAMYGSYFGIEFSRPDSDTFEMRVDRCFFRDFFDRHDPRPVTTVLCGWDANWTQALDPATSGLRSERTSLLSLGADACRFRVLRTDDPLADHSDALEALDGQVTPQSGLSPPVGSRASMVPLSAIGKLNCPTGTTCAQEAAG
jgi:hypothetical protein